MNIVTSRTFKTPSFPVGWDLGFFGSAVDARGQSSTQCLKSIANEAVFLEYSASSLLLRADESDLQVDELSGFIGQRKAQRLILDATTLGFAEILLLVRAARDSGVNLVGFIYSEPGLYDGTERQFGLSDAVVGYKAIPGYAVILDEDEDQQGVFFLGYEGERLDQAFEDLKLNPGRCSVVFGVPAYRPGWEMNAFANNARVMRERNIGGGVDFCAATSPGAAIQVLSNRLQTCGTEAQLQVAPIGTKPHAIGVAVFADLHRDIGILYDHPTRRDGRSREVFRWHYYEYRLGNSVV
jgi:hypothetical protein